jgi:type I restriction enzyme S subunit
MPGLPYIGLEHISQGQLSLLGYGKSEDVVSAKFKFRKGDILFGKLRPYFRKVVIAPFDGVCSTDIWVVRARDGIDQRYLFYWMASEDFIEAVSRASEGTKMPRAQWEFAERIQQQIPPLPEQRAIAAVLGALDDEIQAKGGESKGMRRILNHLINRLVSGAWSVEEGKAWLATARRLIEPLDDKIELNRRMNRTLEAIAQAVFRHWFVENEEAEGWEVGRLGDLVTLVNERIDPTPQKDNERYIALDDMPSKSIDLSQYRLGLEVNSSITRFKKGDILFGSMRPYFHKVGIAPFDGITRTTTFVLRPKEDLFRAFALYWFFSDEVIEFSTTSSVGTTIPYVRWETLAEYEIPLPPRELMSKFSEFFQPLWLKIVSNGEQSRTLAALRDALLPKLMRGEVRVTVHE